jgi:hypothetical protein
MMTEPKKPLTDAERLLHEAFKGLLLEDAPEPHTAEGPEDLDDPVDREREG